MKKISIIGAGLAGTVLAIYLARRGYQVAVYEHRDDIRKQPEAAGRSINLDVPPPAHPIRIASIIVTTAQFEALINFSQTGFNNKSIPQLSQWWGNWI